jgi:hypothetical protein
MKKILMIVSAFMLLAILPVFIGQAIANVEISDTNNVKVVVGKGQTSSYIAWKYTGNADNWMKINRASGLKTDLKSQRRLFVGTILVIPQSLLKSELLPLPTAVEYKRVFEAGAAMTNSYNNTLVDLLAAQQQVMYWKVVVGVLMIIFVLALLTWITSCIKWEQKRKTHDELKKEMAFKTRENKVIVAEVSKVLCPICNTEINPKNFLSHYFQQHGK